MRDPLTWSLPLGRIFGITVRVHILFPVVALGLILRAAYKGAPDQWIDVSWLVGLLFLSVLLHEFGHCAAARWVDGDASEILLWPLGGLAYVEVPNTPRAHFLTALGGPAVNLLLCAVSGVMLGVLFGAGLRPPIEPIHLVYPPLRESGELAMSLWDGAAVKVSALPILLLTWFFWVNWILLLVNLVLAGFPMDMGRIVQAVLWRYVGYRQATVYAVFLGFLVMFILTVVALWTNEILPFFLAVFIGITCRQQLILLEHDGGESVFGYDFSQGYTSLERDEPTAAPPKRKQNWWQRWQQARSQRRIQREQEVRESEERRMDELLEKVQQSGLAALTDEERRFLKRVSDRYRNRH
jgi:stage IV sporulation protein FB